MVLAQRSMETRTTSSNTAASLGARLSFIRSVLWGGSKPTRLHPERIVEVDNVLAVVSSPKPDFLTSLLEHRKVFPDVSDKVVKKYMNRLGCKKPTGQTSNACEALNDFLSGTFDPQSVPLPFLRFGSFWEVNGKTIGDSGYEVLYMDRTDRDLIVASFGSIAPDNTEEEEQIVDQIDAQSRGEQAANAGPSIQFAMEKWGSTQARGTLAGGRTLAFLGQALRVYVRRADDRWILITGHPHDPSAGSYVLAAFPDGNR